MKIFSGEAVESVSGVSDNISGLSGRLVTKLLSVTF